MSRPRVLTPAFCLFFLVLSLGSGRIPTATAGEVWSPIPTSGPVPSARRQQAMIVDEVGDRLVVVGGEHGDGRTWALSLAEPFAWTDLAPAPPGADEVAHAIYDPVGRRMILVLTDCAVWALDLANPTVWTELIEAETGPPPRRYPVVVHDSMRNRLILFGGGPDTGLHNDVWALNLHGPPTWVELEPTGVRPSARWGAVGVYDASADRLVVFSGLDAIETTNDLWGLSLANPTAWVRMTPPGLAPQRRYLAAAIFDPVTSELLVFDGHNGTIGLNNMYSLDLSNPEGAWIELVPSGASPTLRWSHRVVYSHSPAAMITWGGWDGSSYRSDAWMLFRADPGGPPRIFGFSPAGGQIGDEVTIVGISFEDPMEVTIGGVVAAVVASSLGSIKAIVPAGAVTGPITVTTASGTVVSEKNYFVGEAPILERSLPDSARAGETVELRGRAFASTTRISFGGTSAAPFTVLSDTSISVTVDTLAKSGPIKITTLVGTSESAFSFQVIADDPRPRLLSVRDVGDDQGGRVHIRWRASDFDQFRYRSIIGYRVWRRAPLAGVSDQLAAANGWRSSRVLGQASADPDVFWESIAELPATFLAGYAYTAATEQDSTAAGNPYTAFFVQALTKDVFTFYNSSPDSGYSVDDLAPPALTQVAVDYTASANVLHWRCREVVDLGGYRIHRGEDAFFVPSVANLIATTFDTSHADMPGRHFYKLAAVDIHGNVSHYIAISPDRPVATLVSFHQSHREHGLARVTWFSGGNPNLAAKVYRRTGATGWERIGDVSADAHGTITWEDRNVADDSRYGYRLGILEPGGLESSMAEAWIDPLEVAFAFAGRVVNPSPGGRVTCTFAMPFGAGAEVGLYDVAGRELERRILEPGASGERTVRFGETQRLRAGVYLVKASSAGRVVTKRVVVLD